jgi:citrate synthase
VSRFAEVNFEGKTIQLPLVEGTEGEIGIDIAALRKETGAITLDPGFGNTGACTSRITFVDGEKGVLRYRGYPIEELVEKSTFLEVAYLLLNGELPTRDELDNFVGAIRRRAMLPEDVKRFFSSVFPDRAHPMSICASVIAILGTYYLDSKDPNNPAHYPVSTERLIAKLPTIAAYTYKHALYQPFMYPQSKYDYATNFLHLMFAGPHEEFEANRVVADALDKLLILHADHEQNCSSSTVRMVGSSGTNLFASVAGGIMGLWGPRHGGANQAVIEMVEAIYESGEKPEDFMNKVKDKKSGIRLMGFGHRVYKNYDPRASILKKACYDVLQQLKKPSPLLEIATRLEEVALSDEYFVERKLYPNVDFYSGIIYQAMGIPKNMFTVMFAMGRLPGWIAQWREMNADPGLRISRPRQIYVGEKKRTYVPIEERIEPSS